MRVHYDGDGTGLPFPVPINDAAPAENEIEISFSDMMWLIWQLKTWGIEITAYTTLFFSQEIMVWEGDDLVPKNAYGNAVCSLSLSGGTIFSTARDLGT